MHNQLHWQQVSTQSYPCRACGMQRQSQVHAHLLSFDLLLGGLLRHDRTNCLHPGLEKGNEFPEVALTYNSFASLRTSPSKIRRGLGGQLRWKTGSAPECWCTSINMMAFLCASIVNTVLTTTLLFGPRTNSAHSTQFISAPADLRLIPRAHFFRSVVLCTVCSLEPRSLHLSICRWVRCNVELT